MTKKRTPLPSPAQMTVDSFNVVFYTGAQVGLPHCRFTSVYKIGKPAGSGLFPTFSTSVKEVR